MNWHNTLAEYAARGVQVVAVVAQSSAVVRRYIEETGLPFNILVDESRDVLRAYGVWHRHRPGRLEHRAAGAVPDRSGTGAIRYSFIGDSQEEFPSHEEIVKELEKVSP